MSKICSPCPCSAICLAAQWVDLYVCTVCKDHLLVFFDSLSVGGVSYHLGADLIRTCPKVATHHAMEKMWVCSGGCQHELERRRQRERSL